MIRHRRPSLRAYARTVAAIVLATALVHLAPPTVSRAQSSSCSFATNQRLSTAPAVTGNRVVFVYVVPQGAEDERLDLPRVCTDGSIKPSALEMSYLNMSTWKAKELASRTGSLRFRTVRHRYTNPDTGGTATRHAAFFVRSPISSSTWDCWSPGRKLNEVRDLLIARGFANPSHVYGAIIQGRQTCTATGTAGVAWLATAGTSYGYGYVTRFLYVGNDRYAPGRFGCANYSIDAVLAHEMFHVLGAVPVAAAAADTSGHSTAEGDVMRPVIPGPFATREGATYLRIDRGDSDYRTIVFGKPWFRSGLDPSRPYRLC